MAELDGGPADAAALEALGLVNYGHFTSMRVDEQHVRGLSHHLQRLVNDCRTVFDASLDRDHVRALIRQAVGHIEGSFVARVTVFDPELSLGQPSGVAHPLPLVTTRPAGAIPASALRVQAVPYTRDLPTVKHVGLFGSIAARRQAQESGYDDALFIDGRGFITEGATWNVGFFDGSRVIWPSEPVLPGVTMTLLKQVHESTVSARVNVRDLPQMEAAFATNTTVGVRPIRSIDTVEFAADHPVLEALLKEYAEIPAEQL